MHPVGEKWLFGNFNSVDDTVSIQSLLGPKNKSKEGDDNGATTCDDMDNIDTTTDLLGEEKTVHFPCYANHYPTEMLEYLWLMMMTIKNTCRQPL